MKKLSITIVIVLTLTFLYLFFFADIGIVLFKHEDKIAHTSIFIFLTFFLFTKAKPYLTICVMIILAITSEYLQHFLTPTREFSIFDIAANISGIFIAVVIWPFMPTIIQRIKYLSQIK